MAFALFNKFTALANMIDCQLSLKIKHKSHWLRNPLSRAELSGGMKADPGKNLHRFTHKVMYTKKYADIHLIW